MENLLRTCEFTPEKDTRTGYPSLSSQEEDEEDDYLVFRPVQTQNERGKGAKEKDLQGKRSESRQAPDREGA
jgi:hypothetical protein